MGIEFKAPKKVENPNNWPSVFEAGSIDEGEAEDWQSKITDVLSDAECIIMNPRRDNWDSSWEQSIDNPQFKEQVEWELKGMEDATFVVVCLTKGSKAPISLLELGLHVIGRRMLVFCPEGFYRKGNVDVVCNRYGVPVWDDFDEFSSNVKARMLETIAGTHEPEVLPAGTIQEQKNRFVTASDKIARRIMAREFVIGMWKAMRSEKMNVAQELVKVAKAVISESVNTGLALDGMNNVKARRVVNDIIRPHTRGLFSDQYWQPVQQIWKALSNANINWSLKRADYSHGADGNTTGKDWKFEVYFTNNNGRFTTLYGNVRAAWAGSVAEPSEKYDLVAYVS